MKYQNIIAATVLGICVVIAACILSASFHQLGEDLRAAGTSASTLVPRFPDTITLSNGNSFFNIRVKEYDQPIPVKVEQAK